MRRVLLVGLLCALSVSCSSKKHTASGTGSDAGIPDASSAGDGAQEAAGGSGGSGAAANGGSNPGARGGNGSPAARVDRCPCRT